MGVFGTFCQICAMPTQHNCYVPMEGGMLFIYRGEARPGGEYPMPAFPFGPEHNWLKDAVALRLHPAEDPAVIEGSVDDGFLTSAENEWDADVEDGVGERAALHMACWQLSGQSEWEDLQHCRENQEWTQLQKYHGQLFEFDLLVEDGLAWMTSDPQGVGPDARRNRERILKLISSKQKRDD